MLAGVFAVTFAADLTSKLAADMAVTFTASAAIVLAVNTAATCAVVTQYMTCRLAAQQHPVPRAAYRTATHRRPGEASHTVVLP